MSSPTEPDRRADGVPTVVEIGALTRRLRELSARGRHAEPVERAAFLADKHAHLARISGDDTDAAVGDAGPLADRVAVLYGQTMAGESTGPLGLLGDVDATSDGDGSAVGWSR